MSRTARRRVGLAGLAALGLASVPLAAPGDALVPGLAAGGPPSLEGMYGGGLGIGGGGYLALLVVAFLAYLAVLAGAGAVGLGAVAGVAGGLLVVFALAPPLLSQDVFSYVAYSRMGAEHGLDPYEATPRAIATDPVFAHVGWRDSVSAYGPLFTLATFPLAPLGVATSVWALKWAAAGAVAVAAGFAARLASTRGADPAAAAAMVALNPLVLVHVVGGGHNDGLMMAVAMAGAGALLAGHAAAGGGAVVAAAGIKASGAFVALFALVGAHRWKPVAGGALAAVTLMAASLAAFGADATAALGLVGENQATTSHYSLPATVARIAGMDVDPVRIAALALYAAAVLALLVWTWRDGDWLRAAGWAGLGLLVATGWLLPWYLVWALPLVAVSRDGALIAATLALTGFQLVNRVPL